MRARYLTFFILLFLLSMSRPVSASASLKLTHIGGVAVEENLTAHTSLKTNPEFRGTAVASSTVKIVIDDKQSLVQADANGSWLYGPYDMTENKTYQISIIQNDSTLNFPLTIASSGSTDSSGSTQQNNDQSQTNTSAQTTATTTKGGQPELPEQLPETGASDTVVFLGLGLFFLTAGFASRYILNEVMAE